MNAFLESWDLVITGLPDAFFATLAVAICAPLLGGLLVMRRMPLLGLAYPQMASCARTAALLLVATARELDPFEPLEPVPLISVGASLLGVALGSCVLLLAVRNREFLGVAAGIAFLLASALQDVLMTESPYVRALEEAGLNGGVLSVLPPGRNRVIVVSLLLAALALWWRRPLWVSAFDPDQSRLNGHSPRAWTFATLALLGVHSAVCVPVLGPLLVLALTLIPPAMLRERAPSLGIYFLLSALAGVLSTLVAFLLACHPRMDWPVEATLVLSLVATCGILPMLLPRQRSSNTPAIPDSPRVS